MSSLTTVELPTSTKVSHFPPVWFIWLEISSVPLVHHLNLSVVVAVEDKVRTGEAATRKPAAATMGLAPQTQKSTISRTNRMSAPAASTTLKQQVDGADAEHSDLHRRRSHLANCGSRLTCDRCIFIIWRPIWRVGSTYYNCQQIH